MKETRGRKSKFKKRIIPKIKRLILSGKTDIEVSSAIGVNVATLRRWKRKDEVFRASVRDWKKEADIKVEKALYKRAIGYEYDEVVYEKSKVGGLGLQLKDDEIETIKHTPTCNTKITVKQVAPDVMAQIFWLKNRQPDQWRDKHDLDINAKLEFTDQEADERINRLKEMLQASAN